MFSAQYKKLESDGGYSGNEGDSTSSDEDLATVTVEDVIGDFILQEEIRDAHIIGPSAPVA